jgi:23S rRNA (pseudouridine1915-N3)-methyltransferase
MLGKTRRPELRTVIEDYVKRLRHHAPTEILEVRNAAAALKKLDADRAATTVLLDAAGKNLDSTAFAKWLGAHRDRGQRELIFLCGDADGFPEELRHRARASSCEKVLVEQLYRAFAILSGSPYPK